MSTSYTVTVPSMPSITPPPSNDSKQQVSLPPLSSIIPTNSINDRVGDKIYYRPEYQNEYRPSEACRSPPSYHSNSAPSSVSGFHNGSSYHSLPIGATNLPYASQNPPYANSSFSPEVYSLPYLQNAPLIRKGSPRTNSVGGSPINTVYTSPTDYKSQPPTTGVAPSIHQGSSRKRTKEPDNKVFAFISHCPATFPSQEPSIDNAQLARRKRRRTSSHELSILQLEFEAGPNPNKVRRQKIAERVKMEEKAVQIWFQNKRQSIKRNKIKAEKKSQ